MADEQERPEIGEAMKTAVQAVVTDYAEEFGGASLVGDLIVLMEAHCADGMTVMRHIDSAVASWRQIGMLSSAIQTLHTEEVIAGLCGPGGCEDA